MRISKYTYCLLLMAFLVSVEIGVYSQQKKSTISSLNEKVESEAIKKTIEQETECYLKDDYECFKQYHIQTDYESLYIGTGSATTPDGKSVVTWDGWKVIESEILKTLAANKKIPHPGRNEQAVERSNFRIHFFSSSIAYVTWDQYLKKNKHENYKSKEARIMEKDKGMWKIAAQFVFTTEPEVKNEGK